MWHILLIVIFFLIGVLLFILSKKPNKNEINNVDKSSSENSYYDILEALESRKQSQIDYIDAKMNDIYSKLEIIESQLKDYPQYSKNKVTEIENRDNNISNHMISQNITTFNSGDKYHNQFDTIPFILNLLTEPRTSTDIKNAIGKTREHTARLLKKLYEDNFVERDSTNKPFKYKITELGKNYLSQNRENNNNNSKSDSKFSN